MEDRYIQYACTDICEYQRAYARTHTTAEAKCCMCVCMYVCMCMWDKMKPQSSVWHASVVCVYIRMCACACGIKQSIEQCLVLTCCMCVRMYLCMCMWDKSKPQSSVWHQGAALGHGTTPMCSVSQENYVIIIHLCTCLLIYLIYYIYLFSGARYHT